MRFDLLSGPRPAFLAGWACTQSRTTHPAFAPGPASPAGKESRGRVPVAQRNRLLFKPASTGQAKLGRRHKPRVWAGLLVGVCLCLQVEPSGTRSGSLSQPVGSTVPGFSSVGRQSSTCTDPPQSTCPKASLFSDEARASSYKLRRRCAFMSWSGGSLTMPLPCAVSGSPVRGPVRTVKPCPNLRLLDLRKDGMRVEWGEDVAAQRVTPSVSSEPPIRTAC